MELGLLSAVLVPLVLRPSEGMGLDFLREPASDCRILEAVLWAKAV